MLEQFQHDLEDLIGNPTDLRPFICEGSPLACKVFIVGFNPATELSRSFWDFWQPGYGFQKAQWFEVYKQERREKTLPLNRKRRNEISNTRRVIEWMIEELSPTKCLETNIYARPTTQAHDLHPSKRITKPFDFLLDTIRPGVIFVHGQDAVKYLETKYSVQLKQYDLTHIQTAWGNVNIMAAPHLSRGWSEKRAREIAQVLEEIA
jgi:hypothetical protein